MLKPWIVGPKAMMASPGAIICPDFKTVGIAYDRFVDYVRDGIVRRYTSFEHQKQMELLNGKLPAAEYPDISIYNCAMAPPGTELHVDRTSVIPVVVGILTQSGHWTDWGRMTALWRKADIQFQFAMHAAVAANARVPVAGIWLPAGPAQPHGSQASQGPAVSLALQLSTVTGDWPKAGCARLRYTKQGYG